MKRRKKQLSLPKIICLEFLLIIFFTGILCYVFLINILNVYERQVSQNIDSRLDSVLVDMESKKSFPTPLYDKSQILYVINSLDGEYILARKNKENSVDILWQDYENKNLYEMRKLKKGWIKYPELPIIDFFTSRRIIRYKHIPSLDWIVILEANLYSKWDIITNSIKFLTILQFSMFFLLEILLVIYSMNRFNCSLVDTLSESLPGDQNINTKLNDLNQGNEIKEDGFPPDVLDEFKEDFLGDKEIELNVQTKEDRDDFDESLEEDVAPALEVVIDQVKNDAVLSEDDSKVENETVELVSDSNQENIEEALDPKVSSEMNEDSSMTIIGQALSGKIENITEPLASEENEENQTVGSSQLDEESSVEDKESSDSEAEMSVLDRMIKEMKDKK